MASSASTILRLEIMADGEKNNQWGTITNKNLKMLEATLGGYTTLAIADTTAATTLTVTDYTQGDFHNAVFELTGTLTADRTLEVPAYERMYIMHNNTTGGYAVTVKVNGQTGITLANGKKTVFYVDGTDVRPLLNAVLTEDDIGVDVQAYDANLAAIAGLTPAADRLMYWTGASSIALATLTSFARTLMDDANAGDARTTIDVYSKAEVDAKIGGGASWDGGTFTNPALGPDGSRSSPTYSFSSDSDTGMFFVNGASGNLDYIGMSHDTMLTWALYAGGWQRMTNGSYLNPAYSFIDDGTMGMFRYTSNVLGFTPGASVMAHADEAMYLRYVDASDRIVLVVGDEYLPEDGNCNDVIALSAYDGHCGRLHINKEGAGTYTLQEFRYNPSGSSTNRVIGTVVAGDSSVSYNSTSDRRAKFDIVPVNDDEALDLIMALNPVWHRWNIDPDGEPIVNFIADEAQRVAPWAVTGEPDAVDDKGEPILQQMDPGKLVGIAVAGLRAALREVQALRERVEELEDRLDTAV